MSGNATKTGSASDAAEQQQPSTGAATGGGGSSWSQLYSAGVMRVNEHYTKECECGKFYRKH